MKMCASESSAHANEDLIKLKEHVFNGRDVAVVGGKPEHRSDLVSRLFSENDVQDRFFCVRVSIGDTHNRAELAAAFRQAFLEQIDAELRARLRKEPEPWAQLRNSPYFELGDIFNFTEKLGRPVLLAIEEIQAVTGYGDGGSSEALLRTLVQNTRCLTAVFTGDGIREMGEMFRSARRPFYMQATFLVLSSAT